MVVFNTLKRKRRVKILLRHLESPHPTSGLCLGYVWAMSEALGYVAAGRVWVDLWPGDAHDPSPDAHAHDPSREHSNHQPASTAKCVHGSLTIHRMRKKKVLASRGPRAAISFFGTSARPARKFQWKFTPPISELRQPQPGNDTGTFL